MKVFDNYSRYYDLLYKDKDYESEAGYVFNLIKKYNPDAKKVLELGCGTGKHAELLAQKGVTITGIDLSTTMLDEAIKRKNNLPENVAQRLSFKQGNICDIRLEETFDVVISLFHVISYQTTNEALRKAFETAKIHLNTGGLFIFDVWYGPAVLTDKPSIRIKRLESDDIKVIRIAEPQIYPNDNTVDVNYHVIIQDKASGVTEELKETHKMRYLFKPEIDLLFEANGFKCIHTEEWLSDKEIGNNTWSACFVGERI